MTDPSLPRRPKIAIACQGGGSQTAFTAGALKALLQAGVHRDFQVVTLCGTSGGAICAALVWYALRRGDAEPWARLDAFWAENTASTAYEQWFNDAMVSTMRAVSRGRLPIVQTSPGAPATQLLTGMATALMRPEFADLGLLLRRHIDFDEVAAWGSEPATPNLLMGAVDVLGGQLEVFHTRRDAIRPEHILASCTVPNLFPAVEIDGRFFWDGLFSDNPPIAESIVASYVGAENFPEEIWVIKINPTRDDQVPAAPEEISDRRNQLEGNLSLFQQLHTLDWLNDLKLRGAFRAEFLDEMGVKEPTRMPRGFDCDPPRPWHIPFIEMSPALQSRLDYESKLDRSARNIGMLMADGEAMARAFLKARVPAPSTPGGPNRPGKAPARA